MIKSSLAVKNNDYYNTLLFFGLLEIQNKSPNSFELGPCYLRNTIS